MLILHRSERADQLVDALGELLAAPPDDPVVADVVSVPTRGVERWITQRLSHRLGTGPGRSDGVCANLRFPFPGTLIGAATARATGIDPASDPWAPERLVWPLIDVMDDHAEDPVLGPLAKHLAAVTPAGPPGLSAGSTRRFATARRLADLFDRYSVHRPAMIRAWAAGDPPPTDGATEDSGHGWQPHLWRLVRAAVGVPSLAERLAAATERMAREPGVLDLPDRIAVFGLTRLPAAHLDVLDAIAIHRDVHLFLLHPSDALWRRTSDAVTRPVALPSRSTDPTARLARHPLLRSWGRDAREMELVILTTTADDTRHYPVPPGERPTVLQRLQADIRADREPGVRADRPVVDVDPGDRSFQVHACHGRMRQVEVLRDAVLHLLEDDPTLEARDVIVMCPDIETFAPLIQAVFGVDTTGPSFEGGGTTLRVRLADRSLRQTNPLLGVAAELLDLAGSRVAAPSVVDLISRPPVSRRFGFDQDGLAAIERWVAGTAIRWGIDAEHRRPWSLTGLDSNSWAAGMDRLMLGVAVTDAEGRTFGNRVPYDGISSSQLDLAGRFVEMITRLAAVLDRLAGPQTPSAWVDAIVTGIDMLAQSAPGEEWQREELRAALGELDGGLGSGPALSLDEARSLLAHRLQGRPTTANFRTGDLTICTLVPMRSVPHRVVALLGLDDGEFPRHPEPDGDDLLWAHPVVGDRDARSEDRQLLLDALLAATDHLLITYCGRDERTNRSRPPCAPVAELLDVVDATVRGPDSRPARDTFVVHHPLQPFDPRNFRPGELSATGSWSFDPVFLHGARAALSPAPPAGPDAGPLSYVPDPVLALDDLVSFVQHPARSFLRTRLSLRLGDWAEELDDRLPLELGPLDRWGVGDRLLEAVLSGVPMERAVEVERHRGLLPPGALADQILDSVGAGVVGLVAALERDGFAPGPGAAVPIDIELPGGRRLFGAVPHVRDGTALQCVYSKLGPKHRLAAWVRFLALTADRPGDGPAALTVGRGQRPGLVARSALAPLGGSGLDPQAWAFEHLAALVDLYDRGMTAALPMACATSALWAEGRLGGLDDEGVLSGAAGKWLPSGDIPGERDDPEHVFTYGRFSDVRILLEERPWPDESGPGWAADETTRFGRLARRLWEPLLAHESAGPR